MICYAFIGIQGSGKGTQAILLSEVMEYQHINIGDLFRFQIGNSTKLGRRVQDIIQRGELVQDCLVFELIEASTNKDAKGIVFDGFPRTIHQAEYLLKQFNLKRVFYLDIDESSAFNRISARRVCENCQDNYNIVTKPPMKDKTCDKCGGKLIIRLDDTAQSLKMRFKTFFRETQPLKKLFEQQQILYVIDANSNVEDTFAEVLAEAKRAENG